MIKTKKKKTYGNTWWGSKWIEALERIDSNRLARGKTYANTGRVIHIKLVDNQLTAKVKGNWASSYGIKIKLNKFNKEEIKKIKEIIINNTSIAFELSMGILPDSLLNLLESANIELFPTKWKDIKANCSCPDYANPCKHLAAVYYIIANEIDKDPFLLFDLKGLNKEDLQNCIGINDHNKTINKNFFINKFVEQAEIDFKNNEIDFKNFNFRFEKLNPYHLTSLLQDNPSFFNEGNFKDILENIYKTVSKDLDEVLFSIKSDYKDDSNYYHLIISEYEYKKNILKANFYVSPTIDTLKISKEKLSKLIDNSKVYLRQPIYLKNNSIRRIDLKTHNFNINSSEIKQEKLKGHEVGGYPLIDYFLGIPIDVDYEFNTNSFRFFNILSSMAINIVKANTYIPEVIYDTGLSNKDLNKGDFRIRYIPFLHNDLIKEQIKLLEEFMPANICILNARYLKKEGVIDLLSLFITHIVNKVFYKQNIITDNKLLETFLFKASFSGNEYFVQSMAQSVENWLQKLYISKKDIVPIIRLESTNHDNTDYFEVFVDIINRTRPLEKHIPFSSLFEQIVKVKKKGKKTEIALLENRTLFDKDINEVKTDVSIQLIIASEYMPQLKEIVDTKGQSVPAISFQQMGEILSKTLPIFNFLGIEITLPKELKKLAYPYLTYKAKTNKKANVQSFLSTSDLLNFTYEISIGEETISATEFRKLMKTTEGLVKYKDKYILLKPDEVQNILQKLKEPLPTINTPMQALFAAFSGQINGIKFNPDKVLSNILADLTKVEEIEIPQNLSATLRGYQERGFKWLYSNSKKNIGSCIADDMGLGKTIQVITLILKNKEEENLKTPALIICPTTLVGNWYKECAKFAPGLNIEIYHGADRNLKYKKSDIVISTYGILRRDLKKFQSKNWSYLIIDEAQNIKNADTEQTKAVKSIKANNYIAMTGTPVENKLTELWNIFDFINKGYLGSISGFTREFATPIEKYKDTETIEKLKKATAPLLLRRLKTDKSIISDLPDKVTIDEYCYLSKEQAAIYENIVNNTLNIINNTEGIERKGLIFKLITSLKQICNHPANYSKQGNIQSMLSGKTLKAFSIVENILENNEKTLIFTQYKTMGDLLVEMLNKEMGIDSLFFHGQLSRKKRDEMIEEFQGNRYKKVMILSLKAGGTGLNLTAASNVIHYDLWWNPAVENQATDRVYRIGQDKKVNVHRLITLGTFEEKIDEIIKSKQELADLTVSTGEKWITELSNSELSDIFSLSKM